MVIKLKKTHWGEFPPMGLSCLPQAQPTNSQIDKLSIPKATDGGTINHFDVIPFHIAIVEAQFAVKGD